MSVTTKATTMFALSTVKDYLGVSVDTADALIAQIADGVSARFEHMTGRVIATRTGLTDRFSGRGTPAHFLRHMDVIALTALTVDDTISVDPADVVVDGRLGLIRLGPNASASVFPSGIANNLAEFSAGWGVQDAATLPGDVVEACLEWVKAIYDEKISGATSAASINIGPTSLLLKPGLGPNIKATIDAWKDVRG